MVAILHYLKYFIVLFPGIIYIMWRNIGKPPATAKLGKDGSFYDVAGKENTRVSVDCSGSHRGLFFGIFILVCSVVSMIVFFVLVEKPEYNTTAVLIMHVTEIVVYFITSVSVIISFFQMRGLKFHGDHENDLDDTLIVIGLCGIFFFALFSIIAGRYAIHSINGILIIASSIMVLIQSLLQTIFILNGLRRSSRFPYHESNKPGRELITFLLVSNIAMWCINTFETLRADSNPIQMKFYGFLPWSIITHISTPIGIFYRFHSTVCLSNIWKNAYKMKKE